jgi:hypothetical protein
MKFPVCGPLYDPDIDRRVVVSGLGRFFPLTIRVTPDKIVVLKKGTPRQNPGVLAKNPDKTFN